MDVVKEDMKLVGVGEDDAKVRVRWRHVIGCGHTGTGSWSKEKKTYSKHMFIMIFIPHPNRFGI